MFIGVFLRGRNHAIKFLVRLDQWLVVENSSGCFRSSPKGPSIKYVMLFLANFNLPSPCHTLSHIPGPPKVRHTSRTPRFLVGLPGLVQETRTKAPCTNSLSIVREGFSPGGFIQGFFDWKVLSRVVFVRSLFCQN